MTAYAIVITELSTEDGGGYLGAVPDLPGCLSDGATPDEALRNTQAAIEEWLSAARAAGRPVPVAGSAAERARSREKALIGAIKALSEDDPTPDARLARLGREIDRLGAVIESTDVWARTDRLLSPRRPRSANPRSVRG
jgi:predicted RNase H-like HicB family nuclease